MIKGLIVSFFSILIDFIQMFRIFINEFEIRIGCLYNFFQYICNCKVRVCEWKVIDGEGQGFNDVFRVFEWIDEVVKWVVIG